MSFCPASTWQGKLEELGFSMLPAKNDGAVRFRLTSPQASKNAPVLKKLFEQSYNETKG